MKGSIGRNRRTVLKELAAVLCILAAVTVVLFHYYGLAHQDLHVSLGYQADSISLLEDLKMMQQTGWISYSDRLGTTAGGVYSAQEILSGLHNADLLVDRICLFCAGGDIGLASNLAFFAIFYLIALVTYFVMRSMQIRQMIAFCGAFVYACLSFIFMRGVLHIVLSSYYFVPLLVLLCFWLYEDERFLAIRRDFFRYKRNWIGFLFLFLLANSGIGYWQFFDCFFLLVTALVQFLRRRKPASLYRSACCILGIALFMLLSSIPQVICHLQGNAVETRVRTVGNAELYCLKIVQLVMPVNAGNSQWLLQFIQTYNTSVDEINENATAYIGLIGTIGLLILLVLVFARSREQDSLLRRRLLFLADLNIAGILLGTLGGFGTMFFLLVTHDIRCYNRISVYLAFFCILTVCLLVNAGVEKLASGTEGIRKTGLTLVAYGLFGVLCAVSIRYQYPDPQACGWKMESIEANKASWYSDQTEIRQIEASVPAGSTIFQLPYFEYPEGGQLNGMTDYDLMKGYIHSDTLKWTYGVNKGTPEAEELEQTSLLPASELVPLLRQQGYAGIYIQRNAYTQEEIEELEQSLSDVLQEEPMRSENQEISFFKL